MLRDEILADIGVLLGALQAKGLRVTDARYDSSVFGNYHVDLSGSRGSLRVVRDRGYYHLGGDDNRLRELGLFRSFKGLAEFREAALAYALTVVWQAQERPSATVSFGSTADVVLVVVILPKKEFGVWSCTL